MAPKIDPNEVKYVYVRQYGGEPCASSVLAPKLGPLGMSPKVVGDSIVQATQAWKGLRVTVKLTVQNRQATVELVPTATSLLMKELKEPVRDRKKVKNITHNGNISLDQVFKVAREMREKSMAKEFSGTVKEMLGTCSAIGCTVDNMSPVELQKKITNGEVDCPTE